MTAKARLLTPSNNAGQRILTGVLITLLNVLTIPLTNARSTSISKDNSADFFKDTNLTITFNRSTNLLRTRSNCELALDIQSMSLSLLGDRSSTRHILIRRVSARTDESNFKFLGPVVLLYFFSELRNRGGEIRGERSVNVRLEFREVLKKRKHVNL